MVFSSFDKKISTLIELGNVFRAIGNNLKWPGYSLGINEVGYTTAKILSKHYTSIEELAKSNLESLEDIKDIGPIVAKNIIDFFKDSKNIEILKRILNSNVNI